MKERHIIQNVPKPIFSAAWKLSVTRVRRSDCKTMGCESLRPTWHTSVAPLLAYSVAGARIEPTRVSTGVYQVVRDALVVPPECLKTNGKELICAKA